MHEWFLNSLFFSGLPWWLSGKESSWKCNRCGKISWRRKWQPTPVILPEKSHGQGRRLKFMGSQKNQTWLRDQAQHSTRLYELSRTPAWLLITVEVVKLFHKRERKGSRSDSELPRQPPTHTALHLITGVYNHLVCGFSSKNERIRLPCHMLLLFYLTLVMWPTLHQAQHKPGLIWKSLCYTRDTSAKLAAGDQFLQANEQ